MADISIHTDGEVKVQPTDTNCLLVDFSFDLPCGERMIPIARDRIYFHGTIESFRDFASKILAALPAEPEPECTCEQTDVDRFDARGCELHAVAKSRAVNSLIVSDRPDEDLF